MDPLPKDEQGTHEFVIRNAPSLVKYSQGRLLTQELSDEEIEQVAEHVIHCQSHECENALIRESTHLLYEKQPAYAAILVLSIFEFNDEQIANILQEKRYQIADKRNTAEKYLDKWLKPFGVTD